MGGHQISGGSAPVWERGRPACPRPRAQQPATAGESGWTGQLRDEARETRALPGTVHAAGSGNVRDTRKL